MKNKVLVLVFLFFCQTVFAQFDKKREFAIVTGPALLDQTALNTKAAGWGDFDNDGWLDLYVANYGSPNEVYINDANPAPITGMVTFTNISATSFADFSGNSVAVACADYNNDGFDDVFLATENQGHKLYKSFGNGTFINVADSAVAKVQNARSAAWGDFNNDGEVDLVIGVFEGTVTILRNNNGTSFSNVSAAAGITGVKGVQNIALTDINKDGLLDIYLVKGASIIDNDNEIYLNNSNLVSGSIHFQQANGTYALGNLLNGYAADFGDIDNDGDIDAYIGNNGDNVFLRNISGVMTDQTVSTGTGSAFFTNGVSISDIDLNGYNDIFVLNNTANPRMMLTSNGTTFSNKFADLLGGQGYSSPGGENGICHADFDNDGDVDYFVPVSNGQNLLIRNLCIANQAPSKNTNNQVNIIFCGTEKWLGVNLQGIGSNRKGIGSRVTFKAQGQSWYREVVGNGSPGSQSSYRIEIGFGQGITSIDTIQILWPSGIIQNQLNVPTNQIITIVESGQPDIAGVSILAPPDSVIASIPVFPKAVFTNLGVTPSIYLVYASLDSAGIIIWADFKAVSTPLAYLDTDTLTFAQWIPHGNCLDNMTMSFEAIAAVDVNPTNNILTKIVTLKGQDRFIDRTLDVGGVDQPSSGIGYGIGWGDYDQDDDLDLFFIKGSTNCFYRNNGDGTFLANNASGIGLGGTGGTKRATILVDFDNDGDLDILMGQNVFLHNGNLTNPSYTTIPVSGFTGSTQGVSALDYDKDTYLDFYVARDGSSADLLFHSSGIIPPSTTLTFTDFGVPLDVAYPQNDPREPWQRHTHTVTCADYNHDGWTDIYAGHDNHSGQFNRMFRNNGLGANGSSLPFTLVTGPTPATDTIGAGHNNTWGSCFGDYNNDGLIDIFISATNIFNDQIFNVLYQHTNTGGNHHFTNVALTAGVAGPVPTQTWESGWADYDNDGFLDLFVGNTNFNSHLYHNNQNGTFTDVAALLSIPSYINQVSGVSWADYDNDGLLDVCVGTQSGPNRILKNEICNVYNQITFNLIGTASNVSGIGASLKLYANGMIQHRQIIGGVGRSMESLWAEFGIGTAQWIDSLVIDWQSGIHQVVYNAEVYINTKNDIIEGLCIPTLITNPSIFEFLGGTPNQIDSSWLKITNNSQCWASITDVRAKFPYNSIVSASKTDFVIEPMQEDSVMIYYLHVFPSVTTEIEIIYNAPVPHIVPLSGTLMNSVSDEKPAMPQQFSLHQNYPNPFNPTTTIEFDLTQGAFTKLAVYNTNGQLVKELLAKNLEANYHKIVWDGTDQNGHKVSSGIYFYRINSGKFVDTKKMLLLK
ncbi:VCBS repeat-containing protein [bacterium]|nr:VCBS repeat-containing protein [bacterium]